MTDKLHEECGVFAIYDPTGELHCAEETYNALYALQHRGQESCGIAVCGDDGSFEYIKDAGYVNEVLNRGGVQKLQGSKAIGHVRYSSSGEGEDCYPQPLVSKYKKGTMAIANNGGLVNRRALIDELEYSGAIFHTDTAAEIICYLVARERARCHSMEAALSTVMGKIHGAYSLVIMTPRKIIAARDPHGIRPLCIGEKNGAYVAASETAALDAIGAKYLRDVEPGEIVVFGSEGMTSFKENCSNEKGLCVFEYIFFARPDSVIEGQSVYEARKTAGRLLAQKFPVEADVVTGVPDSGLYAATGYAEEAGIPFEYGLIKNRYVHRMFLHPSDEEREKMMGVSLNVMASSVKGKRVVLVDDSVVRGVTGKRIVAMLREAGAKEVHLRITAPQFMWPCFFGTDIPDRKELIAVGHSVEEIKELLNVDSIGFLDVESLKLLLPDREGGFCAGCLTGKYPVKEAEDAVKNLGGVV
ncbi:MAG: amidophosphoribosyltransferase [Clostridia bacterium]|nr:amidophosphoribosyltransferase [Clostridia bacterium]